ncbi:MAG: SAM-dependent methyltransferase [Lamprobacter sp.]|uniref:SAM-dependent methyltransferase n=1 Tax=Lamprobacter sp. TaxID=3100796 RepID=UPI002B25F58E|nr:SAM-dependent methyltransferase [Lamprobacter sp.]MEA3640234.1 SAM-dependent methyltransferase [Lamprobacter sp.]
MAWPVTLLLGLCILMSALSAQADPDAIRSSAMSETRPSYQVQPIGWIRKRDGRTFIEFYEDYRPALLGVDQLDSLWVLYWFDRNDTPEQRSILQVHPRGNPANPLRGVFATRAPMRPNLIAMSRCRVLGVEGTVIEIDDIDAFAETPVLDLKP